MADNEELVMWKKMGFSSVQGARVLIILLLASPRLSSESEGVTKYWILVKVTFISCDIIINYLEDSNTGFSFVSVRIGKGLVNRVSIILKIFSSLDR